MNDFITVHFTIAILKKPRIYSQSLIFKGVHEPAGSLISTDFDLDCNKKFVEISVIRGKKKKYMVMKVPQR